MFGRSVQESRSKDWSEEPRNNMAEMAPVRYPENAVAVSVESERRDSRAEISRGAVAVGPSANSLLGSLPVAAYEALLPHLEDVALLPAQVLQQQGTGPSHVYFPESGILTLTRRSRNGEHIGIGVVGSEGMVGGGIISSAALTPTECTVQLGGSAKRISAVTFDAAMSTDSRAAGSLAHLTAHYAASRHADALQSVLCQSLHTVLQRSARWMLMMDDRVSADHAVSTPFPLTHSTLAAILGVRRAGVTVAAGTLQRAGLIQYRRGSILVTDRAGLEARSCDCYMTAVTSDATTSGEPLG